jgi:HrpA-like RNA helicase
MSVAARVAEEVGCKLGNEVRFVFSRVYKEEGGNRTSPRRVVAMSVTARVAEEVGCKLGNEVRISFASFSRLATPFDFTIAPASAPRSYA